MKDDEQQRPERPVDYILRDLETDADAIAESFLRYLKTGEPQETITLPTRYVAAG